MFNFKQKIKASIGNDDTKNVAVMVPLEYLSKFLRTLIMAVINCEINVILTWSVNCVTSNAAANKDKRFAITDTTLYILVITLSTEDNAELLQELQ